jgi:hypothetical protein
MFAGDTLQTVALSSGAPALELDACTPQLRAMMAGIYRSSAAGAIVTLGMRRARLERHHRRWREQAGDDNPAAVGGPIGSVTFARTPNLPGEHGGGIALLSTLDSHHTRSACYRFMFIRDATKK